MLTRKAEYLRLDVSARPVVARATDLDVNVDDLDSGLGRYVLGEILGSAHATSNVQDERLGSRT